MDLESKPREASSHTSKTQQTKPSIWAAFVSWLVPGGLLILCLLTASAFFLATTKAKFSYPAQTDLNPQSTRGGIFRFPLLTPIMTLDPARASQPEIILIQQIFDGLTAFDEQLNIVPALAQYWEISPDGKTYTFELRPDALFHNGRSVTAEDCVFSFKRLITPGLNQDNYPYFSRIEGAEDFHEGRTDSVSGLLALDKHRFQIRFTTPFIPALSVLSMYCSKILPKKELLEMGDEFFTSPIGTGPFRFSRWIGPDEDPGVPVYDGVPLALRLEANGHYFFGAPSLDGLLFRAVWNSRGVEDEQPIHERFDCIPIYVDKYIDWTPVQTDKLLLLHYFIIPNEAPPYDNPRVRRALNYAMDKRSLLDSSPVTMRTTIATGIVPPGIPGFLPIETSYQLNLKRARRLLIEAGYPEGRGLPPLEIPFYEQEMSETLRQSLIGCMANIGVKVRPVKFKRIIDANDPLFKGRAMLFGKGWNADFPDPDNFMRPLFHSASPVNYSGYNNPDVDRLLEQAWSESSYLTRNRMYHRIEKLVFHDSPVIPLDYGRLLFHVRPNVRGFSLSPMGDSYIKMNKIWLAGDEDEALPEM